jgi:hypothetical protein
MGELQHHESFCVDVNTETYGRYFVALMLPVIASRKTNTPRNILNDNQQHVHYDKLQKIVLRCDKAFSHLGELFV